MTSLVEALTGNIGDAFQSPEERRDELARDLVAAAYLRGKFVLSSGQPSNFYFDKYLFATKPTVLRRLASLLAERIPDDVDRLASAGLGAVPIAVALSLETGIPFLIIRTRHESYGARDRIEGELHAGERVLLVEDVVSTGAQALRGAYVLEQAGATIARVVAVVDREQGGTEAIAAGGYRLDALFRLAELPLRSQQHDPPVRGPAIAEGKQR